MKLDKIADSDFDIVSFDIFDTLIIRPFYTPTDLFYLIENKIQKKLSSIDIYPFHDLRIMAEENARKKCFSEEVTLDNIYEEFKSISTIPANVLEYAQSMEQDLEIELCSKRNSLHKIYSECRKKNKKIIFVSDMYLNEEVILRILNKAGYVEGELFLSSTYGKTKNSGALYDTILKKFPHKKIVHIGDNYDSDYIIPRKKGIQSIHIKKTISNFKKFEIKNSTGIPMTNLNNYFGIRCAYALIANSFFDKTSEVDNTPEALGYVYFGLHLYAIAYWLIEHTQYYKSLVFCARDGFLPMKASKIIKNTLNKNVNIKYFMSSRDCLFPLLFSSNNIEIILNNADYTKFSPADIYDFVKDFLHKNELAVYQDDKNIFKSKTDFIFFLKQVSNSLDKKRLNTYIKHCKTYFDTFFSGSVAFFDIGYSLRTETILKNIYKYNIDSFSICNIKDIALRREELYDIKNHTFYDFTPLNIGGLREALFSKVMGSCVRYTVKNGHIKIVFGKLKFKEENENIIKIQRSALQFVQDFCSTFKDNIQFLKIRNIDSGIFFENFMNSNDKKVFSVFKKCKFEDIFSSKRESMSLYSLCFTKKIHFDKIKKALYYLVCDPRLFLKKFFNFVKRM